MENWGGGEAIRNTNFQFVINHVGAQKRQTKIVLTQK